MLYHNLKPTQKHIAHFIMPWNWIFCNLCTVQSCRLCNVQCAHFEKSSTKCDSVRLSLFLCDVRYNHWFQLRNKAVGAHVRSAKLHKICKFALSKQTNIKQRINVPSILHTVQFNRNEKKLISPLIPYLSVYASFSKAYRSFFSHSFSLFFHFIVEICKYHNFFPLINETEYDPSIDEVLLGMYIIQWTASFNGQVVRG